MTDPTPFPNIKNKLHAPTKKSAFEKAKAEAEAKRLREEAETAAVYEDFIRSFSQDDTPAQSKPVGAPPGRGGFGGGPGGRGGSALRPPPPSGPVAGQRRHFTAPSTGVGAGKVGGFSLGSGAGRGAMEGPAGRKRNSELDDYQVSEREKRRLRDSNMGILAFENSTEAVPKRGDYFPQEASDEDEDDSARKEQPKPTVQLSNLPPGFTKDEVRVLFKETNPNMILDSIRLIPTVPLGPSSTMTATTANPSSTSIRKAQSAIVILSTETPSSEIDALTSTLQNRYLGLGFRLSISRQLASAALAITQPGFTGLGATASRGIGNSTSNPFGAKALGPKPIHSGHQRAPPPSYHHPRGFAPPASFSAGGGRPGQLQNNGNSNLLQVHVTPPASLRMLKLIHKTVESVFTHGPEFEALLMSQPSVRKDESWSFLFDTRSEGHAYYRWRLWEVLSGTSHRDHGALPRGVEMFEGPNQPLWVPPKRQLRYEWAGNLNDIVDDPDYRSDGEGSGSDSENEDIRRDRGMRDGLGGALPASGLGLDTTGGKEQRSYLGPLNRGKLMWLVSRVPTSTTKVRRGDVARVMAFAIENASAAEEIVEVLVGNVIRPLGFQKHLLEQATSPGANGDRDNSGAEDSQTKKEKAQAAETDISGAKIVALYLLSDVLSNSSLGIRNAWRYRGLVEQKLREAKVMESLGRTYHSPDWGRIRREKFRRLVVGVLSLWEGWNVFPQGTIEEFMRGFMDNGGGEREGSEKKEGVEKEEVAQQKKKSRWKAVDTTTEPAVNVDTLAKDGEEMVDGEEEEDVDGVLMVDDDENVDGVPLEDGDVDDVDGVPMQDDEEEPKPPLLQENEPQKEEKKMGFGRMTFGVRAVGMGAGPPVKRKRPKAEDMFADDDED